MAVHVVEVLEEIDVGHDQREGLAPQCRLIDRLLQHLLEMAAIGEAGERVGQRLGPCRFQCLAQIADLVRALAQLAFELGLARDLLAGRQHQRLDPFAQLLSIGRRGNLLRHGAEPAVILLAGGERPVDQRHHALDLGKHLQAGALGLARQAIGADELLVEGIDVGGADFAVAGGDHGLHRHAERRHLAAEMRVPDLESAGITRRIMLSHRCHDLFGEVVSLRRA